MIILVAFGVLLGLNIMQRVGGFGRVMIFCLDNLDDQDNIIIAAGQTFYSLLESLGGQSGISAIKPDQRLRAWRCQTTAKLT